MSAKITMIEFMINDYEAHQTKSEPGPAAKAVSIARQQLQDLVDENTAQAAEIIELKKVSCPTCIKKGNMDGTGRQPRSADPIWS
jgi:hypothetical protein